MFRFIAIIVIIALIYSLFTEFKKKGILWNEIYARFKEGLRISIGHFNNPNKNDFLYKIRMGFYWFTIILVVILILTSFIPVVILGIHMSGILLLLHVIAALFFCFSFTVLVLLTAHNNRLLDSDLTNIEYRDKLYEKLSYWGIVFFSIPAIVSIVLMLYPIFGSEGIEFLNDTHRYSVLMLVIAATIHTYYMIINNKK
ncbi:MAG: hypothetical protein M0P71_08990 [Melioribacteraceae bacterium]|nr:hypothetical protein [Melioribacteraceae bacterium]